MEQHLNDNLNNVSPIDSDPETRNRSNTADRRNKKEMEPYAKDPRRTNIHMLLASAARMFIEKRTYTLREVQSLVSEGSESQEERYKGLRIKLEAILSATSNFAVENLIRESEFGKDYKGQMQQSGKLIDIVARRLDIENGRGFVEFWTEFLVLYGLKHKNIISVIAYCDSEDEKIIIYEHAVHGSLDQHLSSSTLKWLQRLKICLGVARALSYIHYNVMHCGINSSKIFLDENWEAKVSGFELSTKYPESWWHRLFFSHHFATSSYIDPVYLKTTIVTPKFDVYSFGVIMFLVLCGRGSDVQSLAEDARHNYQEGKLGEMIDPSLRKQMDSKSLTIFSETAFNCLKEELEQRPAMDQVVKDIEEALELQWKHENIEISADEGISSNRLKRQDLERLRIQLSDIKLATDNFNKRYCIGSGGYGMVYKADLNHVDVQNLSSVEWKNKDLLPKKRSTVAIKQIFYRQDELGKLGFLGEIELLTSCKHPNVVSLLGFSSKDREMILVYEFLVNGSLDDYLGSTEKKINLTWNQRMQICLDIAEGLRYLHTNMEGKPRIIHRDIKSANVLLDENWNAKIADFGLSKFHPANQPASTIRTNIVAGTEVYLDPEYSSTGKYKKESDIYSFGVVLFEILSGRLAYDSVYVTENSKGLAPIARRRFNEGTLKELIDHKMMEEDGEHMFTLNRGPHQDSFRTFSKIAYQCLAETQARRPTIEVIIEELYNALKFQGETTVLSRFQRSDIVRATENFAEKYRIGLHEYGMVYKADLNQLENKTSPSKGTNNGDQPGKCKSVAIKCISSTENGEEEQRFFAEIKMRTSYKHPNIVSLLGFCDEGPDMILVYKHAYNRSLADYLRGNDNNTRLTWVQRLHKCLDIARGLDHLHTTMDRKERIIHGDINSANIMLSKNLVAKIAYFGISKFHPENQKESTPITDDKMAATWLQRLPTYFGISKSHRVNQEASTPITNDNIDREVYRDPEYKKTGILKVESDMYSFGVVLFELFCGRLANDPIYYKTDKGLAPMVRRCFNDGTIKNMIDPKLLKETDEDIFTSSDGPNQDSVDTFLKTAYQCLRETQAERPTAKTVMEELVKAIKFQENLISKLQISLEGIKLATENFSQENFLRGGRDWKAYKGELASANNAEADGHTTIVAKRWNSKSGPGDHQFSTELDILFNRKHENIIRLVGYCNEMDETIIVYKHASNGSLDEHLNNASLTWMKRLRICINIASGLVFLHGGDVTRKKMVHGGIKSASIRLTADWKAQISDLEFCSSDSLHEHKEHASDDDHSTFGNLDPVYAELGSLTTKSDIYSFGVILFEILCGRLAWGGGREDHSQSLVPLAKCSYEEGKIDEMVFRDIKQQIVPQSLTTFAKIAYECLSDYGYDRPEASEVVIRLKEALMFQEDEEIWDPKLPSNYKAKIDMSENPGIYSNMKKKDIYKMLSEGIFLPKGKVWFSLSKTGQETALVSAKLFSYENSMSRKWRSPGGSRFHTVAKMLDVSNLDIQIKIKTAFLSLDIIYGVHLVFKFCDARKFSSNLVYVNLKYRTGSETSHAYFAKQRDDGWLMIEICQFFFLKENSVFEVSLESISRYYCGSGAIYVQGIEFQAIDNMKHEGIQKIKEIEQIPGSNVSTDQMQQWPTDLGETTIESENNVVGEKLFFLSEVNGKMRLVLSAAEVLHNSPELMLFNLKPSSESRFQNVMELLPRQVFRIKYKIDCEKLSSFTEYACYLVYKLSETCHGLHCPVKVQDLLHRKEKKTKIIYFRSPPTLNQHDASVPKQRNDGWMEVMMWKFVSKSKLGNNRIPMNLKLITYEGTMSGLTICGLDFRPM